MDLSYIFSAGIFVHLALLFYVLGLLTRDELLLRWLILIGTICYIIYYYFIGDAPLWGAIWASAVIGATNIAMIFVILREKSTVGMDREMLELFKSFPTLNSGQFRKIMKHADRITAQKDTVICTRGVRLDHLFIVSSGNMMLRRDTHDISLGPGNFVGEISFLMDGPATADVIAPKGVSYIRWDRETLKAQMNKSMRLSNAVSALFNKDIARKLSVSWPIDESRRPD